MRPPACWRASAIAAEPKRRLLLDRGVEDRGVVLLGGQPERLILARPGADGVERRWRPGDRVIARVRSLSRGLGMAFLDAGPGMPEVTAPVGALVEGALVCAEVASPARRDKLATARVLGASADHALGPAGPRPTVAERLQAAAPSLPIEGGAEARTWADAAQDEALQSEHLLPGGARLFIEPTRALIAVDVDVSASAAAGDAKRRRRQANLAALAALPRLLRLKGLGGLVAVDLAGKGHDGPALTAAAQAAFPAVDGAKAAIGPISRFGVMQLQLPWLDTPVAELLLGAAGLPSPLTHAFALLRAIEREAGPGGRVAARCAPAVFEAAASHVSQLKAVIGDRFTLVADPTLPPDRPELTPL